MANTNVDVKRVERLDVKLKPQQDVGANWKDYLTNEKEKEAM